MIIQVSGKTRAGKTSLVTAMILNEYMSYRNTQYQSACKYIKFQNKAYNTNLTLPPQRHVVSANFDIYRKFPSMKSYPISGFEFGVPNKYCKTKKLIPYGIYAFDESNKYWDSKDEKKLPPWVTQAFEWSGHIFLKIFLITQRYIRLHTDIRGIVDRFIFVEKSLHTFQIGNKKIKSDKFIANAKLLRTEWFGREFAYEGELEAYLKHTESYKDLGQAFYYVFNGDIRKHYNPTAFAVNMENLDNDYEYYDFGMTERPPEWDSYKQQYKKEIKEKKEAS